MAKPRKIHKKKSFMFTSRHYSLLATVSFIMSLCSIAGMIVSILVAFTEKGKPSMHLGGVGLFGMLGNVVGIISAATSLRERDIFRWVSYVAMGLNILGICLWALIVFVGM